MEELLPIVESDNHVVCFKNSFVLPCHSFGAVFILVNSLDHYHNIEHVVDPKMLIKVIGNIISVQLTKQEHGLCK